jgi:hypothetical protein
MPREGEEFILKKSFRSEFDKIPEMQGVGGRSNSSRRSDLKRDNSFQKCKRDQELSPQEEVRRLRPLNDWKPSKSEDQVHESWGQGIYLGFIKDLNKRHRFFEGEV